MNRSILELPKGVETSGNLIEVSSEYFDGKGRNAPFLELNLCFNFKPSIDIKVGYDIFGLGKVSDQLVQLVKLGKNIRADREIAEYIENATVEWYSDLCYRISEKAIGIIHRAVKVPRKIILPADSLADNSIYQNIPASQQIIRNDSVLKLIKPTENWELLPPNCIERYTLPSGYYLGTKNSVGKPQNGTLVLLPKNERISIRNGEPYV